MAFGTDHGSRAAGPAAYIYHPDKMGHLLANKSSIMAAQVAHTDCSFSDQRLALFCFGDSRLIAHPFSPALSAASLAFRDKNQSRAQVEFHRILYPGSACRPSPPK